MEDASMIAYLTRGMWSAVILAGPPLVVATLVGLFIALLQTIIQLQEQTLPVAVKLIAVSSMLLIMGAMLFNPLFLLTDEIFTKFPIITQ
ncbi:MAG: flagellar biosynthetic protein FliQ [Pseudomonadota bacterium]